MRTQEEELAWNSGAELTTSGLKFTDDLIQSVKHGPGFTDQNGRKSTSVFEIAIPIS